jgi:hypothetical protein
MGELDFLLERTMGEGTEDSVSRLLEILPRNSGAIGEFRDLLVKSPYCRDICPLLFAHLVEMYLTNISNSSALEELLTFFPPCCRPLELHTFALESWILLWKKSCHCTGPNSDCQLSRARSLVAHIVTELVRHADKGPLHRNKENFTLSIAGQILGKFLIPESGKPTHAITDKWFDSVFQICDIMDTLSQNEVAESNVQANAEVALRMLAGTLLCQLVHSDYSNTRRTLECIMNHPTLLSSVTNKLLTLNPNKLPEEPISSRSADFELEDYDIALFVLAHKLNPQVSPRLIPMLWSETKKMGVEITAALCLLRSPFPVFGFQLSEILLEPTMVKSNQTVGWLEELITMATTFGDETLLSLEKRQTIYTRMHSALFAAEPEQATRLCLEIISRSRADCTVGIFIKVLKDIWAQNNLNMEHFHKVVRQVCSSSYQVIDGMDSLKSILNWARLAYLKAVPGSLVEADRTFYDFTKGISCQLDIELSRLGEDQAMQRTRLAFIGHLVSRVREILGQQLS